MLRQPSNLNYSIVVSPSLSVFLLYVDAILFICICGVQTAAAALWGPKFRTPHILERSVRVKVKVMWASICYCLGKAQGNEYMSI